MKHLRVAEARAQFGQLLDEAEQGRPVFVERRGVRFRLSVEPAGTTPGNARLFDHVDPAVLDGRWTWVDSPGGLSLKRRRRA